MTEKTVSFTHSPWPSCAVELLSYVDDAPDFPSLHGSGFFVQREERVYLATAGHCLVPAARSSHEFLRKATEVAARLMIPIDLPTGAVKLKVEDYVQFSSVGYAVIDNSFGDFFGIEKEGNLDVAVLEVSAHHPGILSRVRARSVMLPPTGEWFTKSMKIAEEMKANVPLIASGFPKHGTESSIDYESMHVVTQGINLIGEYCGTGPYPHTHRLTLRQGDTRYEPNGMSGGPIYMRTRNGTNPPYALVGMALRGGHGTDFVDFW